MGIKHCGSALPIKVLICRDKPPAISNGEKQAALYNIACCHSRMGNLQDGLLALKGMLDFASSCDLSNITTCWLGCSSAADLKAQHLGRSERS